MYRQDNGSIEIVLCGRLQPKLWALPKGGPDTEETLEETALREVREETGLEAKIVASLGSIQYWYFRAQDSVRCHKTVHFFLMTPTGGATSLHDPEFDVVEWFPLEEAVRNMNYETEIALVQKAANMVRGQLVSR
ncbi:MAG: NUDIX domain-containing protein [Chloroflexi bacterium]|nr:NUDIX domain-containing protein [Chloroflexota bacterium]